MSKAVFRVAMKDIAKYNDERYVIRSNQDRFFVNLDEIFSKQSIRLNRILGVNRLNYKGNKNGLINYRKKKQL